MAGFTTHYIFGSDMIEKLSDEPISDLIKKHRNVYNLGLQGPDIFFYNMLIAIGNSRYKFGEMLHKQNTNLFFSNAIDYINNLSSNNKLLNIEKRHDLEKKNINKRNLSFKKEILEIYLYGLLAHYALDTRVHPYVYSRAGYIPEKNNSSESFGIHSFIEINIDKKYLMKRNKIMPSRFYQHKTVLISKDEQKAIEDFYVYCIIKTYYRERKGDIRFIKLIRRQIKISIISHRILLYILHDKHGFKRRIVQLFEKYILGYVAISNIILTNQLNDTVDSMNLKHLKWHHPWNKEYISYESFNDLYNKAGDFYINLLSKILDEKVDGGFINYDSKNYILDYISDKSYHSGLISDKV